MHRVNDCTNVEENLIKDNSLTTILIESVNEGDTSSDIQLNFRITMETIAILKLSFSYIEHPVIDLYKYISQDKIKTFEYTLKKNTGFKIINIK